MKSNQIKPSLRRRPGILSRPYALEDSIYCNCWDCTILVYLNCIIKYGSTYLIVGIDKECIECNIFVCLEIHLTIGFSQKTYLNALVKL